LTRPGGVHPHPDQRAEDHEALLAPTVAAVDEKPPAVMLDSD
jgi:hypothetical protein